MCFGTEGGFGPTRKDTFGIHLPGWLLTVEAPGYETTDPFELNVPDNYRRVVRGKDTASVDVVVKLQKSLEPEKAKPSDRAGK
jgi:hypothetical protein